MTTSSLSLPLRLPRSRRTRVAANRPKVTQLIFEQLEARQLLAASEVIYRVNAGGNVLAGDPIWEADNSVSPSPYLATVNSTAITTTNASINMSHPSIPVGTPMTVFQSDRYDKPSGSEMEYNFPVTPGDYEVRLYFAETWSGAQAPGIRVFDVTIEGVTRLDNYDIFADAGGFAGVVKSFPVTNTDGSLDVKFLHQLQNPTIRGLEILREPVLAGSVLEASVNSLDFGLVPLGQTGTQVVTLTNSAPLGGAAITVNPTAPVSTARSTSTSARRPRSYWLPVRQRTSHSAIHRTVPPQTTACLCCPIAATTPHWSSRSRELHSRFRLTRCSIVSIQGAS